MDIQPNQSCLQAVLQEYTFLSFRPVYVIVQHGHLNLLAVGNGIEVIQEGSNCYPLRDRKNGGEMKVRTELGSLCLCR